MTRILSRQSEQEIAAYILEKAIQELIVITKLSRDECFDLLRESIGFYKCGPDDIEFGNAMYQMH